MTTFDNRGNFGILADRIHTRGIRRTRTLFALVLAFAFAAPLQAAELVAIRVGDHPTFTRVVFEFDVAGGYRIERNAAGEAANVVRVTLDAASDARQIESRSPGVASVSVEAGNPRSVARIDAREPSWPIKEMILSDPPRVVLDFLRPERVAAPAPVRTQKLAAPAPAIEPPAPDEKPAPPSPAIDPPTVERSVAAPDPEPAPAESLTAVEAPTFAQEAAPPTPVETTPAEAPPRPETPVAATTAEAPAPGEVPESDPSADPVADPVISESSTAQAAQEATLPSDSTSSISAGTLGLRDSRPWDTRE